MKKEDNDKIIKISLTAILLAAVVITWHPWINQKAIEDELQERGLSSYFTVELKQWAPLGHHFVVWTKVCSSCPWSERMVIGRGYVNLFGTIEDFKLGGM